jgi:tRNA C32,U32 (ribose-2'-O)-methylase TrmJ
MDDIKLYADTNSQLQELYGSLNLSQETLIWYLGLKRAKGKLEMKNFTSEDDDIMEAMNEDDIYRYFGHMQSNQIEHA